MRLESVANMEDEDDSEDEDDPEDENDSEDEDDPEDENDPENEDDDWGAIVHEPLPSPDEEEALVRHLTRLQLTHSAQYSRDTGAWVENDLGIAALLGEEETGEDDGTAETGFVFNAPPGINPMVVADAMEWAMDGGQRAEAPVHSSLRPS